MTARPARFAGRRRSLLHALDDQTIRRDHARPDQPAHDGAGRDLADQRRVGRPDQRGVRRGGGVQHADLGDRRHQGTVLSNGGGADYATLPVADGSPLDVTGVTGITISAWVKPAISDAYQLLIGKLGPGGRQYGLYLSAGGTGQLFAAFGTGLAANIAITTPWSVGAWNLITVTYDGSSALTYINGTYAGGQAGGFPGQFATVGGTADLHGI